MSNQDQAQEAPATPEVKMINPRTQAACDIAAGRAPADPGAAGYRITGAEKDLNCKGRGPEWYRMVYRDGSWRYVSNKRLPIGNFLASDRHATVYGEVYAGEIVVGHDRGAPIDAAYLVREPGGDGKALREITFRQRRDGQIVFTLPDASEVVMVNPRRR